MGGRTELVRAPFLSEVSTDLEMDSGSSFPLSFSLLSSTVESKSILDREDCTRDTKVNTYLSSTKSSEILLRVLM